MKNLTKKITYLITAGPTREYIDPVRYITNASSGKMGYAIAEAAIKSGSEVILVTGITGLAIPEGVKAIEVVSARDMKEAVLKHFEASDIAICTAAVADYRPENPFGHKLKSGSQNITLELVKNPDILKTIGEIKGDRILIGFALDTMELLKNAANKLENKNLDMIVANTPETINSSKIKPVLLYKDGKMKALKPVSKKEFARLLVKEAETLLRN